VKYYSQHAIFYSVLHELYIKRIYDVIYIIYNIYRLQYVNYIVPDYNNDTINLFLGVQNINFCVMGPESCLVSILR